MILFLLACIESTPSALDTRFCEDRCKAAGASLTIQNRAYYTDAEAPAARTRIVNGDIWCNCYFPKGEVQP